MAHSFPRELRILIALAAAALLGGLMIGFTTQQASAAPVPEGPFVNPCVNYYTGQVTHTSSKCPAGTYALDLSTGYHTLCVNMYSGKLSYRYTGKCSYGEYALAVDGSSQIWGCVNTWTGTVAWMPSQFSACNGQALPFDTGYGGCRYTSATASDPNQFVAAPSC